MTERRVQRQGAMGELRHAAKGSEDQGGSGLLVIISGPSGVGKTTITHAVKEAMGGVFSVSCTTRARTSKDREGVDYHFVSAEGFQEMIDAGEFLEWAEVFGNRYGTPRGPVEEELRRGRTVILEIDVRGAEQVKRQAPGAFGVFILPPSEEALLERLRARKREDEDVIQRRFAEAKREMSDARSSGVYDAFVVNDDLDRAIEETIGLVRRTSEKGAGGGGLDQ